MSKIKQKRKDLDETKSAQKIPSAKELTHEELSGHDEPSSLSVSETDDDENEGVGDGKLERSDKDLFKDK